MVAAAAASVLGQGMLGQWQWALVQPLANVELLPSTLVGPCRWTTCVTRLTAPSSREPRRCGQLQQGTSWACGRPAALSRHAMAAAWVLHVLHAATEPRSSTMAALQPTPLLFRYPPSGSSAAPLPLRACTGPVLAAVPCHYPAWLVHSHPQRPLRRGAALLRHSTLPGKL